MKHIVQFSGGKDSTAMLDLIIKKQMPIDEVVFFDTGWEFDSVYANIHEHEQNVIFTVVYRSIGIDSKINKAKRLGCIKKLV